MRTTTSKKHPEYQVAAWFMERKGYYGTVPRSVTKLDGQPCWYFIYDLPGEGILELEVSWSERGGWNTLVTTFSVAQ